MNSVNYVEIIMRILNLIFTRPVWAVLDKEVLITYTEVISTA